MLLTVTQIDMSAALTVLYGLGLAVFGFWFIPAAIGAVAAIAKATESEVPDNSGGESKQSLARYQNPMGAGKMGMAGMHGDWQKMGQVGDVSSQGVLDQREMARQSRQQQMGALGNLEQYATGEKSAARLAAADAIAKSQSAMASQAAAGGGPAAQRAAMYGTAAAGQNIAGTTATAAAQEQLGAQAAYLGGAGQMRAGDLGQFGAEAGYLRGQQAFGLGRQQAGLNAAALGMQQTQQERQAQMAYDRAVRGTMAGTQAAATAERGQNIGMLTTIGSAAAQGLSGAAASDVNVKQGVAPATGADVFGNAMQDSWFDTAQGMAADQDLANRRSAYGGPANAPGEWADPYSPANREVFTSDEALPDESFDAMVQRQTMADFGDPRTRADRENTLGQKQMQANYENRMKAEKKAAAKSTPKKKQPRGSNATLNWLKAPIIRASDDEVKKEKKIAEEVVQGLTAYNYEYKDPGAKGQGPGRHTGVMAQDMEKTPTGDKAVTETGKDGTKVIDYGKLGPLSFAAHAQANDRIKSLEEAIANLTQAADTSAIRGEFQGGGMTPEGGPGAIQQAVGEYAQAADTSGLRGQFDEPGMGQVARASDRTMKQSVAKASDEDLFTEIGRRQAQSVDFTGQPLQVQGRPGAADFTGQPLQVQGRQGSMPVTQPRTAVMQGGQFLPGSNLGTASWLSRPPTEQELAQKRMEEQMDLQALADRTMGR